MNAPKFISDPTIVRWFGHSVTVSRALICLFSAIIIGLVILLPVPRTSSFSDVFLTVIAFPLFYVGILGSFGVFTLWFVGWFASKIITSSVNPRGGTAEEFNARLAAIEEQTINAFILIGTFLLAALDASGKLS